MAGLDSEAKLKLSEPQCKKSETNPPKFHMSFTALVSSHGAEGPFGPTNHEDRYMGLDSFPF